MFEIIVYLFERYMHTDNATGTDPQSISDELEEAGFTEKEIFRAFKWLDGWAMHRESSQHLDEALSNSVRLYSPEEQRKLSPETLGFIMSLEQNGIITPGMRELIIDRAMAIELPLITLDEIKWVSLIVLFCQSEEVLELSWLENLILVDEDNEPLH